MARIIKGRQMAARYYKGREVLKEYKQGRLVYEKSTSIPNYLCFTALEAGQFTLTIPAAVTPTYLSYVEWSKDGRTWTHTDNTSEAVTIDVQVASGDKVYWRGSGTKCATSASSANASVFSSSIELRVEGNPMSLLIGSRADAAANPTASYSFAYLFSGCPKLNHVKCLFTDISATNCLRNWLSGVSSTGTFIQASGVTWPRGASGIPTGWLAYDEGEDIPNDYTPCDYIYNSSTGGGGVDLGFKFRILDYSVEAKFKQDEISNGMVCGTYTNNSGAIWFYNNSVAGSFRIIACYSSGWHYNRDGFKPLDTDTHIIRYVGGADGCYQINDGTQSSSTNISTWAADESTNNLFIFGRAVSSNTYKGRIYYLKVWNTATEDVICNLIPCSRNSDGAAGFWDTAQEQFFTSTYWTAHSDNE